MTESYRIAIVGAGILGLAHAYLAARAGKSVVVFEKNPRAAGASIRNFGMIWPIGQPTGEMLELARTSRALWLEVLLQAKLPFRETGSLHLAYRKDEADVAQEFAGFGPELGYACSWMGRDAVLERSHAVRSDGLMGGLWSSTELTVDPKQIIRALPAFLAGLFGVQFVFNALVTGIDVPAVETTAGRWIAESVIVCSGDDFQTLYPGEFRVSGLTLCKLQMMRTEIQPGNWQLGPSLAAGLTLRFIRHFRYVLRCQS